MLIPPDTVMVSICQGVGKTGGHGAQPGAGTPSCLLFDQKKMAHTVLSGFCDDLLLAWP